MMLSCKTLNRQALRFQTEAIFDITKSMVEMSLISFRHSIQLRSQRTKVCSGCENMMIKDSKDVRVLGVFGQIGQDEKYEKRVTEQIRKFVEKLKSQFESVRAAELEISNTQSIQWGLEGEEDDLAEEEFENCKETDDEIYYLEEEISRARREIKDREASIALLEAEVGEGTNGGVATA